MRHLAVIPVLFLFACASQAPPTGINEIRYEHGCFGCPQTTMLTIRNDGSAVLTATGNSRFGAKDETHSGVIAHGDFDRIASLLVAHGFFDLESSYADPELQDGAWSTITAVRGGQEKSVMRRNGAGPHALDTIEQELEAISQRLSKTP